MLLAFLNFGGTMPVKKRKTHKLLASLQTVHTGFFDATLSPVLRIDSGDTVILSSMMLMDGRLRFKMTLEEMIAAFTLDRVNPKGAIFDEPKLEWLNSEYMKDMAAVDLLPRIAPLWIEKGLIAEEDVERDREYLCRVIELFKGRTRRTHDFVDLAGFCLRAPTSYDEKARAKHWSDPAAADRLAAAAEAFANLEPFDARSTEDAVRLLSEREGVSASGYIHPIRLAVSGMSFGPGLFEMLEVLGKARVVERLRTAVRLIRSGRVGTD